MERRLAHIEIVKDIHMPISNQPITLEVKDNAIDWKCADRECSIIYEDDYVYVAHKESGIIIHGDEDDTDCLMAEAALFQENNHIYQPVRPIHRLDKDTMGLVLFSKIPFFQPYLDQSLMKRDIKRYYIAICKGNKPQNDTFTINYPIGKDRHRNGVYRVSDTGVDARTYVQFLKEENHLLYFLCTLDTGRTHQIRVHLSHTGYPIINDPIYGTKDDHYPTMGLYAYKLEYIEPMNYDKICVIDKEIKDLGDLIYEV